MDGPDFYPFYYLFGLG